MADILQTMFYSKNTSNTEIFSTHVAYIDGLMQERRNSIANALELRLSCTNPSPIDMVNLLQCVSTGPASDQW